MMDDVDYIIYNSGISPSKLPKRKLIGNSDISNIENKYELYKRLEKVWVMFLNYQRLIW